MRKIIIITLAALFLMIGTDQLTTTAQETVFASDKDPGNSLPDPNRNYYGKCGNLYNYQGHLIHKGKGCKKHHKAHRPPYFKGK